MHGAAGAALRVVLYVTALAWVVLEARQARHRRAEAVDADRGSRLVLGACVVVATLLAAWFHAQVPSLAITPLAASVCVGTVVLWLGIALRQWSFATLGRYFTFTVQTSEDQPVIDAGPYRYVRHPSYTALLCCCAGLGLVVANWGSLAVIVLGAAIGLAYRIRVEEQALLVATGGRYAAYARGRKRLVPLVW